jgi:hypothetical protein
MVIIEIAYTICWWRCGFAPGGCEAVLGEQFWRIQVNWFVERVARGICVNDLDVFADGAG